MKLKMLILLSVISTGICAEEWKAVNPVFNPPVEGSTILRTVHFFDKKNGWTVTGNMQLYQTDDGGTTWTQRLASGSKASYRGSQFISASRGWVLAYLDRFPGQKNDTSIIYSTTDGGTTWKTEKIAGLLWSIQFIDSSTGVAGGGADSILRTTDGGRTWAVQSVDCQYPFSVQSFFFLNARTGWAIGPGGGRTDASMILQTNDSGKTWFSPLPRTYPLNSIFFVNENYGFAAGFNVMKEGVILRTIDGGKTWEEYFPGTPWLKDIVFTDARNGWCVGDFGYILNTTDSGLTWQLIETELLENSGAYFQDIAFTSDGNYGFICGMNGYFLVYGPDAKTNGNGACVKNSPLVPGYVARIFFNDYPGHASSSSFFNLAGRRLSSEIIAGRKWIPYIGKGSDPKSPR